MVNRSGSASVPDGVEVVAGDAADRAHTYTYVRTSMRYLFEEPFVVDSGATAGELGIPATPVARALAETRATYAVVAGRGAGNAR
jgi:hypothetical protein